MLVDLNRPHKGSDAIPWSLNVWFVKILLTDMKGVQGTNTHVDLQKSALSRMQTDRFKAWYEPGIASERCLAPGSAF